MQIWNYLFSLLAFACICLCGAGLFLGVGAEYAGEEVVLRLSFCIAALVCAVAAFGFSLTACILDCKAQGAPAISRMFLMMTSITLLFLSVIALVGKIV